MNFIDLIKYKLGINVSNETKCKLGFHKFGDNDSDFIRKEYRSVYSDNLDKISVFYHRNCKRCGYEENAWQLSHDKLERVR